MFVLYWFWLVVTQTFLKRKDRIGVFKCRHPFVWLPDYEIKTTHFLKACTTILICSAHSEAGLV